MHRKPQFGGPGSSHQDRDHPGKNRQPTGHKGRRAARGLVSKSLRRA